EAVERAYGFKRFYLMAENGNIISGILPLIRVNLPFTSGSLVSLPYCDAAGPLADSPDNSEKLLASFKAKLRSQVKKPFKDGLSVRSGGVEMLNEFYPLFAENMRDLGSPVHSRNWIKQILCRFLFLKHLAI
ncbi:MAG: hypothetical protein WC836_08850, partial [Desulfobacula sp.]